MPITTTTIITIISKMDVAVVGIMVGSIRLMRKGMVVVGIRVSRVVGISNNSITRKQDAAATTATNTVYPL
jgi:hypothetical protein